MPYSITKQRRKGLVYAMEAAVVKFKLHLSLQKRVIAAGAKIINENLMVGNKTVKLQKCLFTSL